MPYIRCNSSFPKIGIVWDIGILAIRPYLPDVLPLCEVTKNDGKANEAVLEQGMIALNDSSKKSANYRF